MTPVVARFLVGSATTCASLLPPLSNASLRSAERLQHTAAGLLSRKDAVHLLHNRDDPAVDSAVKQYLKSLYSGGVTETKTEEHLELTSQVEQKYVAAQAVEYGIQSVSVPLATDYKLNSVPVKRYVSEVLDVAKKAGFEDPMREVQKKLVETSKSVTTVKEFLSKVQPYVSTDYLAALVEAAQAVEAESGAFAFDPASPGYKKFIVKVQELATQHKLPVKLLQSVKKAETADEDAKDKVAKEYQQWLQQARVDDAIAELETIRAHAVAALDMQLAKTPEQIRKDVETSLQQLQKKVESGKGAKWAQEIQADLKFTAWFDAKVAANPAVGPVAGSN